MYDVLYMIVYYCKLDTVSNIDPYSIYYIVCTMYHIQ